MRRPRTSYARAGGYHIAYQVVGDGPIDVVLSPGAYTHLDLSWEVPPLAAFLGRLAESCRLILFDKRGTGLSDRLPPTFAPTVDERIDDVVAVMDGARSSEAVLLGTLGGGAVAGTFAATYPDRTLGLILYGTFGKLEPDTGMLARIADREDVALDRIEREWGNESVTISHWAPSIVTDEELKDAVLRLARSALSPGSARTLRDGVQGGLGERARLYRHADPRAPPDRRPRGADPARPQARRGDPGGALRRVARHRPLHMGGRSGPILREVEAFIADVVPRAKAERGLRSLVFTDIVSSTETAARLGDRGWRGLLEQHHRLVRERLTRFGGQEVDRAGDGFFACFERSGPALDCALSITRDIRALDLEVRAGVHTGECELLGGRPQGIAVVIASRVSALAGPGEVLTTGTVRDLVAGSGLRFESHGPRELKGVPGRWEVFRVTGPV